MKKEIEVETFYVLTENNPPIKLNDLQKTDEGWLDPNTGKYYHEDITAFKSPSDAWIKYLDALESQYEIIKQSIIDARFVIGRFS